MATLTENDIKDLKDFLGEQFKQINSKTDKLSEEVNDRIERLSEEVDSKFEKLSEEVNSKIDKLSEEVDGKFEKLSEEVNNLRVDIATLKGELTGTNKRLENLEFINRTTSVAITAALLAGVVKLFFPNLPNTP